MDCLYDWITSHNVDISAVLNIQDNNGDTALNLATRLKQSHMSQQLQEMGANRQIENKIGLRPSDYSPNNAEMEIDELQEVCLSLSIHHTCIFILTFLSLLLEWTNAIYRYDK